MPPTVEDRLRDILEAIGEIQGLLQASASINLHPTDISAF